MKKSILLSILFLFILNFIFSSCSSYRGMSSGNGCGVWFPKKFEKDRRHERRMNWVNNPRSGRYRSGF
jgi:hypothetical protein